MPDKLDESKQLIRNEDEMKRLYDEAKEEALEEEDNAKISSDS